MAAIQHAKLSASGAHRWMACSGSVRIEETLPDNTSEYAEEGTAAHRLAERALREDVTADYFLGETFNGLEATKEMVDAVQRYLNYVRDLRGRTFVEQRVSFDPWVPEGFGTSDFTCIRDGVCTIVDLKYGKGVQVEAFENPQPMLYGLGALHEFDFLYDFHAFKLVIVQPRIDHISEWTVSKDDLLAFGKKASERAARALTEDAPLVPSTKACQFCRARGSCRALAEHNYALAVEGFVSIGEPITPRKVDLLNPEEIGHLLADIEILSGWADTVKSHAIGMIERGQNVPGYKLVEGKSNRQWRDEEDAKAALGEELEVADIFIKKLISPAQAEKKLGKGHQIVTQHSIKPEGKPALAPLSDKRPALEIDPTEGFDAIDEAA